MICIDYVFKTVKLLSLFNKLRDVVLAIARLFCISAFYPHIIYKVLRYTVYVNASQTGCSKLNKLNNTFFINFTNKKIIS